MAVIDLEIANERKEQNVHLFSRHEIKITGVVSVDSFDEYKIYATCYDGRGIVVEGGELSIKQLNLENELLEAIGDIQAVFYTNSSSSERTGFLRGLFSKK